MRLEGTISTTAPLEATWRLLTDPTQLAKCSPGLLEWQATDKADHYQLTAVLPLGQKGPSRPLNAHIIWHEVTPQQQLALSGQLFISQVTLSLAGDMRLEQLPDATTAVDFQLDLSITKGSNAIWRQIIGAAAPTYVEHFWRCIKTRLEAAPSPTP